MSSLRRRAIVWWTVWGGVFGFWSVTALAVVAVSVCIVQCTEYAFEQRVKNCEETSEISGYAYRYSERSGCWLFVNGRWLPARALGSVEP